MRTLTKLLAYVAASVMFATPAAHADDLFGCKVLLCLANPNGPQAVAQCVDPINQLYSMLRKVPPDPFPTCSMASTPGGGQNYAKPETNYYSMCPTGMTPLPSGSYAAVTGSPTFRTGYSTGGWGWNDGIASTPVTLYTGIGDGAGLSPYWDSNDGWYTPLQPMTCVGQQTGTTTAVVQNGTDWNGNPLYQEVTIPTYSQITTIQPGNNGRAIDVFINSQLHNVVHY